jgi:catechol 2,3-dioxygenase-like lactoylglutathione lyase family enzyme
VIDLGMGIAQVKLPVTDLARSVQWYQRLLGLRLWMEFVEDGAVRGAGLIDPGGRFGIALRERSVCASEPDLRGFDVVAFRPESRAALEEVVAQCGRLGVEHGGIHATPGGEILDIPDPDGTVLRFYHFTATTEGFTGVEYRHGAFVTIYDQPRLGEPSTPLPAA